MGSEEESIQRNAKVLEETLGHFKVEARVVGYTRGPVVTMFELALAADRSYMRAGTREGGPGALPGGPQGRGEAGPGPGPGGGPGGPPLISTKASRLSSRSSLPCRP